MIVRTLFTRGTALVPGEVEVQLMSGIPRLHVVGLPDRNIRECGVRIKAALKSSGFTWPRGHQIIVNLRPSYVRKESAGIDLAIALGVLAATGQLAAEVKDQLSTGVVYGELSLDGRVFAPTDLARAFAAVRSNAATLVSGVVSADAAEGRWLELSRLNASALRPRVRTRASKCEALALPDLRLDQGAFQALWLTAHLELSALVVGPQGSGKSTWARLVHATSRAPDAADTATRAEVLGEDVSQIGWRPLEHPHHSATPLAMIGGGRPLTPGVLSRAHGGVLVMDEFLEFHPEVLEALREPMESGQIHLARQGVQACLPARAQIIATSNLCPCGSLRPGVRPNCGRAQVACRRTWTRLSGPILDRFDVLVLSHAWTGGGPSVDVRAVRPVLERLERFAAARGPFDPDEVAPVMAHASHRRRRAVAKVARGLADFDECARVGREHVERATGLVVTPIEDLRKMFG